jgi:hypothetical protein
MGEQSCLYIFRKNQNGWKVDDPEVLKISGMLKDEEKSFINGFSKMVYVKV